MPETKKRVALTEEAISYVPANDQKERVKEMLAQGIVENVKVMGFKSKNKNRTYSEDGVNLALFENQRCNIDHPHVSNPNDPREMNRAVGSPRPFVSRFGRFTGPYKVPGDGVYYKQFKFNRKHPLAETFMEWVLEMP